MSQKNRTELKAYFEVGDTPTESQFIDLIDSMVNALEESYLFWYKSTIEYTDFQPESGDFKFILAFPIPAGYQLSRVIIHPTEEFIGGPIASAIVALYDETNSTSYVNTDTDVFSAPTDKSGKVSPGYTTTSNFLIDLVAGGDIHIKLGVTGTLAEIDDLTQGALDIYYKLDKII